MFAKQVATWLDSNLFQRRKPRPMPDVVPEEPHEKPFLSKEEEKMSDEDIAEASKLCQECHTVEHEELWLPMYAGCSRCNGYVYRLKDDVSKQLGVCGCVVAVEMELAAAIKRTKLCSTIALSQTSLSGGFAVSADQATAIAEVIQIATLPAMPGAKIKVQADRQRRRVEASPRYSRGKSRRVAAKMQRLGQRGR